MVSVDLQHFESFSVFRVTEKSSIIYMSFYIKIQLGVIHALKHVNTTLMFVPATVKHHYNMHHFSTNSVIR